MLKYVAFLRGINVTGHKTIKMDNLRKVFLDNDYSNVKTILASGNVIFDTKEVNENTICQKIGKMLEDSFGHKISVIVRTIEDLQKLAQQNPFQKIKVTPQTRIYVTFLPGVSKSESKIPYESPDKNFRIISATNREVLSVLTLVPNTRTIDLMGMLEKEYGKNITTRNWNTIMKILKASE
jgi:uncharacterized protein (DUF1697 family)